MLDIRNLHKSYGSKTIVDNWNYYFANGKIYGLIGRNGIGKTTILKCICGLLSPETVKIYSERGDLSKEDYLNRDIVYISDEAIYFYINRLHLKEYIDYYLLSMNDLFLTQPFGFNAGTLLPGPLAFRWTFQFYDQSQTSAQLADLLERVSPYYMNQTQVFGVIYVEGALFLILIALIYRRQEI